MLDEMLIRHRKSQPAIEHAFWIQETYPETSVFWVHAGSVDRFRQSYAEIARECAIPGTEDKKEDLLEVVRLWLLKSDSGPWVMIIDNADDGRIFFGNGKYGHPEPPQNPRLKQYIPECNHGHIPVTTRDKKAGVKFTRNEDLIAVQEMDSTESIELLRQKTRTDSSDKELTVLADRLQHLPLAIVQAGAYISENSLSVPEYREMLQKSEDTWAELLDEPFEDTGRDAKAPSAVAATLSISFCQIQEQFPLAAKFLSLMTFFDRQEIPEAFLEEHQTDLKHRREALGVLQAFSLISRSRSGQNFDLHRLVQVVMRKWLVRYGSPDKVAAAALETVWKLYPNPNSDNWSLCNAYLPHAFAVLVHTKSVGPRLPAASRIWLDEILSFCHP